MLVGRAVNPGITRWARWVVIATFSLAMISLFTALGVYQKE